MQWKDYPKVSRSVAICKDLNLLNELNDLKRLEGIYSNALKEIGIDSSQRISNAYFIRALGETVLLYAQAGKIDSKKTLALIRKYHEQETIAILGYVVVCLLEGYGVEIGGPKIP